MPLDDRQVEQVMEELGYADKKVDYEMRKYIQDLISCITTGNAEDDLKSIDMFSKSIAS